MTLVRRIARPMLAAMFIAGGLDALRHPGARVEQAAPVVDKIAEPLGLPNDPELMVRANGVVMVTAGTLLALGRLPRLASLTLATSLLPTTVVDHPFWREHDPATRKQQRTHFLKNLGLLGGVLLAAVDTAGKPGLPWRAQHAIADSRRGVSHTAEDARRAARAARREAKRAASQAAGALT